MKLMPRENKKLGKYHGSNWWNIPGYARDKWMVWARLKISGKETASEENVRKFLAKLSKETRGKRKKTPKYGNLEFYSISPCEEKNLFTILFTTDRMNVKEFEGKGRNEKTKPVSKRGRPRKKK